VPFEDEIPAPFGKGYVLGKLPVLSKNPIMFLIPEHGST